MWICLISYSRNTPTHLNLFIFNYKVLKFKILSSKSFFFLVNSDWRQVICIYLHHHQVTFFISIYLMCVYDCFMYTVVRVFVRIHCQAACLLGLWFQNFSDKTFLTAIKVNDSSEHQGQILQNSFELWRVEFRTFFGILVDWLWFWLEIIKHFFWFFCFLKILLFFT